MTFLLQFVATLSFSGASRGQAIVSDWEVHNLPEPLVVSTDSKTNPESDREELLNSPLPHPYLRVGPALMPGGYAAIANLIEGGLIVENNRCSFRGAGAYDNGHKVNDGDQPNPKGHDRYLNGSIYFHPSRLPAALAFLGAPELWSIGVGFRWSELSTTNYTKRSNRPTIGGGYDFFQRRCSLCKRDFSGRIGIDWIMAGNDWENGLHGPMIAVTYPSPREKRHWFLQPRVGAYRFHETVTEPRTNPGLTKLQQSDRSFAVDGDFGLVFRF